MSESKKRVPRPSGQRGAYSIMDALPRPHRRHGKNRPVFGRLSHHAFQAGTRLLQQLGATLLPKPAPLEPLAPHKLDAVIQAPDAWTTASDGQEPLLFSFFSVSFSSLVTS